MRADGVMNAPLLPLPRGHAVSGYVYCSYDEKDGHVMITEDATRSEDVPPARFSFVIDKLYRWYQLNAN